MEVFRIPASFDGEKLHYQASVEDLKKIILDKNVFILKGAFPASLILDIRKKVFNWGLNTEPSNPPFDIGIADFHRHDLNPPKAAFMRIMHCYSFHFWNQDTLGVQKLLRATMDLKYKISGLPENFALTKVERDHICVGRVTHYPLGGGYYSPHVDPNIIEICTDITVMSKRGIDYHMGGLVIEPKKGVKYYLSNEVDVGDVVYFDPSIPHSVEPISPPGEVQWNKEEGRWMMFSAISEFTSNHTGKVKFK